LEHEAVPLQHAASEHPSGPEALEAQQEASTPSTSWQEDLLEWVGCRRASSELQQSGFPGPEQLPLLEPQQSSFSDCSIPVSPERPQHPVPSRLPFWTGVVSSTLEILLQEITGDAARIDPGRDSSQHGWRLRATSALQMQPRALSVVA
jgi:hypothetical protein